MTDPDELADALWKVTDPAPNFDTTRGFSLVELRTLARAAAKTAWEEGYTDGCEDGYYVNPYSTESYE